ncbi:MAG TPA: protealysin inhibitor emfourin [Vicinamibacterales bacterium]|nr:protealysin inhibitor emfourin [Vicinamibacterales bacterium]
MRVVFRVSGGFAALLGLAAPRIIDVDRLEPDQRAAVERLVQDAHFFDLPRRLPAPQGSADCQSYEIAIEDGTRQHTVVVSDPVEQPAVQALVAQLRKLSSPRR